MSIVNCPICSNQANIYSDKSYVCKCCGKFKITEEAAEELKWKYKSQAAKISALLKQREIKKLTELKIFWSAEEARKQGNKRISIEDLLINYPNKIKSRLDSVLINLSELSNYTGEYINLDEECLAASILYCDSYETNAIFFVLKQLYYEDLIENESGDNHVGLPAKIRLTAKGWSRVNVLEEGNMENPRNAFVAMSFDNELTGVYENAIKKAIIDAEFNPVRVDTEEYNDKICDEIISNIRKAKFIISDVTQQKNGVYFEAGFAMGLGKQVIWTCREDDLCNVHFDTRQYNHIVWKNEEDLYEKLIRRIEATII